MPNVTQVSMPIALTSFTISITGPRSLSLGLRHAAPMQKRLEPFSFAIFAAAITSFNGIKGSFSNSVS